MELGWGGGDCLPAHSPHVKLKSHCAKCLCMWGLLNYPVACLWMFWFFFLPLSASLCLHKALNFGMLLMPSEFLTQKDDYFKLHLFDTHKTGWNVWVQRLHDHFFQWFIRYFMVTWILTTLSLLWIDTTPGFDFRWAQMLPKRTTLVHSSSCLDHVWSCSDHLLFCFRPFFKLECQLEGEKRERIRTFPLGLS